MSSNSDASPSPMDDFFNDVRELSPIFPDSREEDTPPMSPLDLNAGFDEVKTPETNHSQSSPVISPLISSRSKASINTFEPNETKSNFLEGSRERSIPENAPAVIDPVIDLLDSQDLVDFSRILYKLETRAEYIEKVHVGLQRRGSACPFNPSLISQGARGNEVPPQFPSPFKAEVNKRVMLATLYQRMAKTFRKLGLNEYSIVVPPAVRDAAHFLNLGFHPVGTTAWRVGNFHYDTCSNMWSPFHPRFFGGTSFPRAP
jgi:hypothetical protein